jgi:hypothetical protein
MLRILVFKSGVLKILFILSKHSKKANIRSTMMANNRYAYNRDVISNYWTSDGLPLCCSQPTGEKTHTNQQCERLPKFRQTTGNIWSWRQGIAMLVIRMSFATSPVLKQHWLPNRRLSTRTVRNRLKSRRVTKRPLSADRHRRTRLAWWLVTDGRMRVWRNKNTAYTPRSIQPTVPYGGGSVMVWVYLSWLQARFSHHTRQPSWWSVHQRRLATSCCPPFRQPSTSYKACVYGWQRQASSCKSSIRLPPKRSRDVCSLPNHEPGFESHRA